MAGMELAARSQHSAFTQKLYKQLEKSWLRLQAWHEEIFRQPPLTGIAFHPNQCFTRSNQF